jgi:undecaprenyl-diphosphatase
MNVFSSIVLGVLQGLTEFLPVSSSGHLVIAQTIVPGFSQPGVLFDVILHAGTLFAVIFYFRNDIFRLSKEYIVMLLIGTIPAVIVGFLFSFYIERLFTNIRVVGVMLLITAIMNLLTDLKIRQKKIFLNGYARSLFVGIFQAFAIIPGISRSGSTIFAGSMAGFNKKDAAEFSFLLSIPAVFGANIYEIIKHSSKVSIDIFPYLLGFMASFVVGYLSIRLVLNTLSNSKFKYFALYCFILGIIVIILG